METKICACGCGLSFTCNVANQIYATKGCKDKATVHNHYYGWEFRDEKDYLEDLGTGRWSNSLKSRRQLLESYLATIDLRQPEPPWKERAIYYAAKMLFKEFWVAV